MEDKDKRVWAALDAKAAELELGSVYGLVNADPELAQGVVAETLGQDASDDQRAVGTYLSSLLISNVAEVRLVPETN